MKRASGIQFILGVIVGAAIFGGVTAYAAGIIAQPKTAEVVIDGNPYDLKGYVIEGSHYFQLRDLDAALKPGGKDFSVVWDGFNNRIIIDTSRGYDPDEVMPSSNAETQQHRDSLSDYAMKLVQLTNDEREKAGLPPLIAADDLMELALLKSQDMEDNNYVGHDSPVFGKTKDMLNRDIWARFMGENCSRSLTPESTVRGLMASEGHRYNILNPATTHIGVGVVGEIGGFMLWTQVFAVAK